MKVGLNRAGFDRALNFFRVRAYSTSYRVRLTYEVLYCTAEVRRTAVVRRTGTTAETKKPLHFFPFYVVVVVVRRTKILIVRRDVPFSVFHTHTFEHHDDGWVGEHTHTSKYDACTGIPGTV